MGQRRSELLFLLALVAACSGESEPVTDRGLAPVTDSGIAIDSQPLPPPVSRTDRPSERTDTVVIEGMPQVEQLRLVRAPETFAVPFSTYVPEGISVEFETDGDIDWVRFNAAFGGAADERAFMMVRIYPPGTTRLEVEDAVREFVSGRAPGMDVTTPMDAPAWAEHAMRLSYPRVPAEPYLGAVIIARHGPRFFEVLRLYPAEYGDGLGPRLATIMRHWLWEDTGRSLTD